MDKKDTQNMLPVADYMTKNPARVPQDSPVAEAVKLMRKKKIGAILVNDAKEKIVGIFTERDFLTKLDFRDLAKLATFKIKEVMTTKLITVDHQEQYIRVIKLMQKHNIRHMPVMEKKNIVGIVSLGDMMRHYEENLEWELNNKERDLKKSTAKLKESEELFRSIFENSATAVFFADKNERLMAWNPFAARLLGMNDEDLRNKPVKELYPSEEWSNIRSCNVRQYGMKHHLETKVINKEGKLIDVDVSLSVLKDADQKITGSIAVMSDIRTRKSLARLLEYSIKDLEDLKRGLDEHAIVGITDKDGKIIYVNDKFCQISKYTKEELEGQDFSLINSGFHSKDFMNDMWATIRMGRVWKGEFKNVAKDGTHYWVDTTIVPFSNKDGEAYQYVTINTDITERKVNEERIKMANKDLVANVKSLREIAMDKEQAFQRLKDDQQQIIQLEKMATLGTLAAGFAHEIKNPLAIILQGIERIEKVLNDHGGESNAQYINIIKSAALRANTVVTSILRYSRSSQLEVKLVNVYDVIEAAIELVMNNAKLNSINLRKDYTRTEHLVSGDQIMLQQVFFDLFTNAIDALPDGGEITLSVKFEQSKKEKKGKGQLIISVADSGNGIEESVLKKIFDPFYTTKDEGKGTGLGLSTVYLILERHGGTINVKSEMGKGTIFTITLPVA